MSRKKIRAPAPSSTVCISVSSPRWSCRPARIDSFRQKRRWYITISNIEHLVAYPIFNTPTSSHLLPFSLSFRFNHQIICSASHHLHRFSLKSLALHTPPHMASKSQAKDHRYLPSKSISTIESWQRTVPERSPTFHSNSQSQRSNSAVSRDREAVEAYLQLKQSMMAKQGTS